MWDTYEVHGRAGKVVIVSASTGLPPELEAGGLGISEV